MKAIIKQIIRQIQDEKMQSNIVPVHATRTEIRKKLDLMITYALQDLSTEIISGNTINDIYYEI